ncbi:heavy-metal-associated domain-containing protein [Desulfotalea psychrophila]|uniref:Related to mercuric ion-binding protein n=1 Tax=Desulfotalea psychrophila (strain LSv54 / DSM 12343) TaxID=177439 RepID=Q6AN75_DESPS|nr:cation transporter [Desulfotalea psychrophila]CAG36199.1 related to mercuric ion-binding protein [Desulfotalea psychrophila LSv54]
MITIKIEGMSCAHCVASVKEALAGLKGPAEVEVDLQAGEARITGDIKREDACRLIEEQGFETK